MHPGGLADLVGVGWATVELDRAVPEFAPVQFGAAMPDGSLGARARVGRVGAGSLVLLEPSTEGRLAAALARFGEGVTAIYVAAAAGGFEQLAARLRRTGERARIAEGPFGRSFVVGASPWGPHLVVCEAIAPRDAASPRLIWSGYHRSMTDQPAIVLRPATHKDAPRIAALLSDEGYPAGPSDIVARLDRVGAPSGVTVASIEGEVLGFIAVHVMPRFEHGDWIARILALVVDPGVRERGIGRLLMADAERIGREHGAVFVEITAGHHRPDARRMYESLGYDATVTSYLRKHL
jgi:ribosomal protein S18 acetylase RimI-like enzyme